MNPENIGKGNSSPAVLWWVRAEAGACCRNGNMDAICWSGRRSARLGRLRIVTRVGIYAKSLVDDMAVR